MCHICGSHTVLLPVCCQERLFEKKENLAWLSSQERGFFRFPQRCRERRNQPRSQGRFAVLSSCGLFFWIPSESSRCQRYVAVMVSCLFPKIGGGLRSGGKQICGLDYRRESRESACFIRGKNMGVVMREQKYILQFVRPEVVLQKSIPAARLVQARFIPVFLGGPCRGGKC